MNLSEKKIKKLTKIAINEYKKHEFFCLRKQKHISLILCKGKLISIGVNAFKTHPAAHEIGYRFNEVHSEIDAFIKCPKNKKLTLINFRFNKKGQMRNSFPCDLCLPWVQNIFDNVYYSTDEGEIKEIK
jgi:deoxycytidylate deaminase